MRYQLMRQVDLNQFSYNQGLQWRHSPIYIPKGVFVSSILKRNGGKLGKEGVWRVILSLFYFSSPFPSLIPLQNKLRKTP